VRALFSVEPDQGDAAGLSLCAGEFLAAEALDFSSPSTVPISQEEACLSVYSSGAGLCTGKGSGGSMRFTEAEAEAKKRQWVRVRNDAFAAYGINKRTLGQVVDIYFPPPGENGAGPCDSRGGQERAGWVVIVELYRSRNEAVNLLMEKELYDCSLEEIDLQ